MVSILNWTEKTLHLGIYFQKEKREFSNWYPKGIKIRILLTICALAQSTVLKHRSSNEKAGPSQFCRHNLFFNEKRNRPSINI
jgi:hypothetical protein